MSDAVWLLAQPAVPDIPWLNLGILGLVVMLMMVGYLYPKPMIDYLRRENDRLQTDNENLRQENRELRTGIEDRVVPALVRVTDLLDALAKRNRTVGE